MDWIQEPLEQIQWAVLHWLAGLLWSVDHLLLMGGVLIHSLRRWITDPGGLITLVLTQFLQDPAGSQLIKTYLAGGVLLALLLAAFWYFLRPVLGTGAGAPVDVRKVFLWLAVAGFLFGSGPAFASDLEHFRAELSSGAYRVAVQVNQQVSGQGYNNTQGEVPITGSQPFSPTVTLFPQTTHVYGSGNPPEYTGIDVAAAFLLADQEDINGTANGGAGLPGGFEFAYFTNCDASGQTCAQPWPSGYDEPNRQAALTRALNGVIRMETGLVPSLFALLQAFIFLALALAAAILFFSLPLSLVFAFFNTTEIIALAVVRAYIGLLVKTYVTATILSLFMGFLLGWAGGNWAAFLGMSLTTVFFTWQLARISVQTIVQSLNVVTQAIGQATGTHWTYVDPPQMTGQAAGLGATLAMAAATGGTGLAVGSLVSGVGGALGMPGAHTLGTAIALNYRRRSESMNAREMERDPAVATEHSTVSGTIPTVDDYGMASTSGDAVPIDEQSMVIDGEWYEIREAQQRRTRADRWLTAHGIPPVSTADSPPDQPPAPYSPFVLRTVPVMRSITPYVLESPTDQEPISSGVITQLPSAEEQPRPDIPLLPPPRADATAGTATMGSPSAGPRQWSIEAGAIPSALQAQALWVAWRYEDVNGRRAIIPYDPRNGKRASTNAPRTWSATQEAQAALARGEYDGIGFMLREGDPFVGVDLDHCFDPETGTLLPWAAEIVQTLDSYTEVSPSGTGIRIFTRGTLPPRELGRREGPVEMYSDRRFLSVTGQHLAGTPATVEERSPALAQVHRQVFRRRYEAHPAPPGPTVAPGRNSPATLSDEAILDKIRRAKNGQSFERLWQGDTEGYASASEADLALCGMLAFYTQDPAQIERLVEQSGLWDEKWRNRPAYRQGTIQQAIAHRSGTYSGQQPGSTGRTRAKPGPVVESTPRWVDAGIAAAGAKEEAGQTSTE
jgi:hypothetical protein